jgi:phosphatidylinositol glycan class T
LIHYVPALDRQRSHHIEIKFLIKEKSIVNLNLKFENAFLKWNEFPPDAQHGHSINPAVVLYKLPSQIKIDDYYQQFRKYQNYSLIYDSLKDSIENERSIRVYTETLLVNLPAPDFSMPYNVICLTCTVIAIGFGSLHNFTTRKFVFMESNSLPDRIKKVFNRLFKRKTVNVEVRSNETKK